MSAVMAWNVKVMLVISYVFGSFQVMLVRINHIFVMWGRLSYIGLLKLCRFVKVISGRLSYVGLLKLCRVVKVMSGH